MKVAIIGANGFVGSRLVEIFHLSGRHEVIPVVRKPSSLALSARFAIDWRIGDALNISSLTQSLNGCEAIVHTALGDPRQIERMPGVLCAAAANAGVRRVIYLSSASVHGQAPNPGTDESTPLTTGQAMEYNNAKVRAERQFHRECKSRGLTGFALRPGVVFGPRSRWIADLAQDLKEKRAWFWNDGNAICNSIYVDNLAAAVDSALTAPDEAQGPYLVGDAERVTWKDFYRAVAEGLDIDLRSVHRVTTLPMFKKTTKEKLSGIVASPAVQAILPIVPSRLKKIAKRVVAATAPEAPRPSAWSLPATPQPRITQELALLQQCVWKFPHLKAEQRLGYRPTVSFTEGLHRSLSWFQFAIS